MSRCFLAVVSLLAVPVSALAQVTLGQSAIPDGAFCSGAQMFVQLVSSGPTYTVPGAGVITSWSFSAADGLANHEAMAILRPNGGSSYTVAALTALETVAAGQTGVFTVNIPVQAGDVLGVWSSGQFGSNCLLADSGSTFGIGPSTAPAVLDIIVMPLYVPYRGLLNVQATFGAAPVPTLSGWAMILLALSLLTLGTWRLRPGA